MAGSSCRFFEYTMTLLDFGDAPAPFRDEDLH
jgi:hypothetical protein